MLINLGQRLLHNAAMSEVHFCMVSRCNVDSFQNQVSHGAFHILINATAAAFPGQLTNCGTVQLGKIVRLMHQASLLLDDAIIECKTCTGH